MDLLGLWSIAPVLEGCGNFVFGLISESGWVMNIDSSFLWPGMLMCDGLCPTLMLDWRGVRCLKSSPRCLVSCLDGTWGRVPSPCSPTWVRLGYCLSTAFRSFSVDLVGWMDHWFKAFFFWIASPMSSSLYSRLSWKKSNLTWTMSLGSRLPGFSKSSNFL